MTKAVPFTRMVVFGIGGSPVGRLKEEILREFNCSRFTVHHGDTKMYHDLRHQYYWNGMKQQVGDFVSRCLMCQQVKAEHQRPVGLL